MNGALPPGWRLGTLAEVIASISTGVSVNGEDRSVREGEVGVLKITAVLRGVFEPEHHKAVVGPERNRLTTKVSAGTILVSRGNGNPAFVGAAALVTEGHPNLYLPDLLWQVTPSRYASPEWLGLVLGSTLMRPHIARIAVSTSTLKKISQSQYLTIPIVIPPRHEQDRIVEIVQTWDRGILAAEALVRAAGLHVRGLTSRHLDAFIPGTACENASLPLIPLGDAFDERDETGCDEERLLAITGERGVVARDEIDRRDTSAEDKGNYRLILPGDIGYNTMRMWQGVCGLSALRGIVSPAYTVVTPRPGVMDGAFAAALFKAPHMIEWLRRYSQGIVDDTLNLKFEQFRQIKLRLPSLETQRRVANAIHVIGAEAEVTARLAIKLREQKGALLARLLLGDLRAGVQSEREVVEAAYA